MEFLTLFGALQVVWLGLESFLTPNSLIPKPLSHPQLLIPLLKDGGQLPYRKLKDSNSCG